MKSLLTWAVIIATLICFFFARFARGDEIDNKCDKYNFKHAWLECPHSHLRLQKFIPEDAFINNVWVCENCGIIKIEYKTIKEKYVYIEDIANWAFEYRSK